MNEIDKVKFPDFVYHQMIEPRGRGTVHTIRRRAPLMDRIPMSHCLDLI